MEDWQRILQVRSLVLTQQEELKSWIKFASICRKSGKLSLSERTLITLLSNDPSCNIDVDPLSVKFPQVCSKVKQHLQNYFVCACTIVASNCFCYSQLQCTCINGHLDNTGSMEGHTNYTAIRICFNWYM